MTIKRLPNIQAKAPAGVKWEAPSDALVRWDASIAQAGADDTVITMYDPIGSDGWSEGVTAKRVSAALRSIGSRDVTVSINSPGGDFFEGLAIYNLLREHPHKVTVNVVGLAASAASIIAMAGDDIRVAKSGYLMIHNVWSLVVGNRHDLSEAVNVLTEFDTSLAELYASATGNSVEEVAALMDAETWMNGQESINEGFATGLLGADEIDATNEPKAVAAIRKVDTILARQGMTRSDRRALLNEIKGTSGAAPITQDADLVAAMADLTKALNGALK